MGNSAVLNKNTHEQKEKDDAKEEKSLRIVKFALRSHREKNKGAKLIFQ